MLASDKPDMRDVKARQRRSRQRSKHAPFAAIHRRHPFWGPVIWLLDRVWHLIWYLWGLLIIGGLAVSLVVNFFVSGNFGPDPRQWYISRLIEGHPAQAAIALGALVALTALAGLAHRLAHPHARQLPRVRDLDPDAYVPKYIEDIYLTRRAPDTGVDLDALARASLQSAARRADPADPLAALGVCVYGRTMLGKTRLAWEAMRATLPDWRFVKWPHGSSADFDWSAVDGANIALWLDDTQEYANPNEGPGLGDLPRRFAEAGARLVIVATCRAGDDEESAQRYLGGLLDRLAPIRPSDISQSDEQTLIHALSAEGAQVETEQFDGTPGSLLLGVVRMRDQIYPALPEDARRLLRTMKLLRGVGVYDYPALRLRGVAAQFFDLPDTFGAYSDAAEALVRASFVRRGAMADDGLFALDPVADAYLERAVPDFPPPGVPAHTRWPALRRALAALRDANALVPLGVAFNELKVGLNPSAPYDLRPNQQQARDCYEAALAIYAPGGPDWATTQNNLGIALRAQAGLAEGVERATLLQQAVDAYRAALTVRTRETATPDWAGTQNNLGAALRDQAGLAEGAARATLLQQAVDAYHAALTVYTRQSAAPDWAMTQNNLGLALRDQAGLAEGAARATLLQQAVDAYHAALTVYTRASAAPDWAATQNNLGNALRDQAGLAEGAARATLLQQAVEAYRAALSVRTRETAAPDWAATQNNLGVALRDQAGLAEGAARATLLQQAVEAYRAALSVYTREADPVNWAGTQFNLAVLYLNLADEAPSDEEGMALVREALTAAEGAREVFAESDPVFAAQATQLCQHIEEALGELGAGQ